MNWRHGLAAASGDVAALLFALMAVWASFTADEPEAYVFPQLISILMLVFCGINFVRRAVTQFAGKPPLDAVLLKKIAPGAAVICVYILTAETVGFYLAAAVVFATLSLLYGAATHRKQVFIVTGAVVAVLYSLFSLLLRVQVPREFFL
ncbi:tripartite tricarboxylate transporter TctB family protein [Candidatus Persebacteraceae bacterium Df01]|jgi:cation transport ATPase|uniref:Tripartite tricarboxylate transporter TctB family protein n=1 Tax=Candidatus Doriopsillibacter californiensis TaxID=2970740 RepID=A0ABT7QK08_9GAMM|nr:tripartite tricarboxylate transporter TctB family protein [Candidatus Persebacteraceae bacterium Df01]